MNSLNVRKLIRPVDMKSGELLKRKGYSILTIASMRFYLDGIFG